MSGETDLLPLVIHVPHASTLIPAEAAGDFVASSVAIDRFVGLITDHFTDELFRLSDPADVVVRHEVSRLVVDPERFEDDAAEPMAARGYGVLYERDADGQLMRPSLSAERRSWLLDRWYRPHQARLSHAVNAALQQAGRVLIVDLHSFPSKPMAFDLDQRTPRPDMCIGTSAFHTPLRLIEAAREHCAREGWTLGVDWPYAGTMVPIEHLERTPSVMSIMVEINRDRYMRLEGNRAVRSDDFEATRLFVERLLDGLRAAAALVVRTPTQ